MKVCMIIDSLAAAGAERVVVTLAEEFYRQKHIVHIILLNNIIEYEINSNIRIHTLKEKNPYGLKTLISNLESEDSQNFNYIYSHLHGKIKIVKKAKLKNIFYLFHIPFSRRFTNKKGLSSFFTKIKLQLRYKNENLITVSNGIKYDLLEHKVNAKSITTIYNPFNFQRIKKEADEVDKSIPKEEYIINVARFHFQKRHDILLKAFAKSKLNCKLLLVGKGSKKEELKIKLLIKELNLTDKVELIGFKKNPYPLIKNAKLFVLSSDFEGFGMVLVESLILNTPIVSTNCISGPSEIMINELSNYLVPTGDVEALAKKMEEAFQNYPDIDKNNLERFNVEKIVKEYLSIKGDNHHENTQ